MTGGAFMKTHRELLDNYYEASWALAMERVAVRQGKEAEALEERLNNDPAAAVPGHTIERCQAAIRRAFRPAWRKRARRILSRALIAAVLCGVMTSVACAVSPDFREFLSRVFYSVAQTFTAITLRDPQVEDVGAIQKDPVYTSYGLQFEWLPEGYEPVDGDETAKMQWVDFENAQSGFIRVQVIAYDDTSVYNYDSESGTVTTVTIMGFTGQLVEEDGQQSLFWMDDQQSKFISIMATDLPEDKLILLAQGLTYY